MSEAWVRILTRRIGVVAAAGQHAEVMNALHEINSKLDYRENLESVRVHRGAVRSNGRD